MSLPLEKKDSIMSPPLEQKDSSISLQPEKKESIVSQPILKESIVLQPILSEKTEQKQQKNEISILDKEDIKTIVPSDKEQELIKSEIRPNCYLIMSKHRVSISAASAKKNAKGRVIFLSEGWAYELEEDAKDLAERFSKGKRKVMVRPWNNDLINALWGNDKAAAKLAKKAISLEINQNKNNEKLRKIESDCEASGLHKSWLHREAILSSDDLSDIQKQAFEHYKPLWEVARNEKAEIELQKHDINLAEEDLKVSLSETDLEILNYLAKNEIGDAELFVKLFGEKYLYDPTHGKEGTFYIWNSRYWEIDIYKERYKDFNVIADAYLTASKDDKLEEKTKQELFARSQQLRTNNRRRNVLETITAYTPFKGVWDYVPKLLPCSNGIIDLTTGDFSPYREDQFIRKVCPIKYNKSAKCPKFIQFLNDISLGNIEWIKFLQRSIGYALLGVPVEEVLIYWYGEGGRNGKGTLTKILQHVFGPLARTFPAEMILLQRNLPSSSVPSPELANLEGVRIAIFSEINEGRKIDSAKVKNLSGRDKISCRRLFSNHDLQIEPTHTIFLQTNYKPKAPSDDNALWSRNILVSFNASFVREPKKKNERPLKENLKEELLKEAEGILLWVLDGVREYLSIGLQIPDFIKDETELYRKENDGIGRFLEEMCVLDPVFSTKKSKMETEIKAFCIANDCKVPTRNEVSTYLNERFRSSMFGKVRIWEGVKIIEEIDASNDFHS